MKAVKEHVFEGIVAKRLDSRYEPGQRSGAWLKMRINQGQEFVIGGYTPSGRNFDALIFGYYEGDKLLYAARTRNGFTPATRHNCIGSLSSWKFLNVRSRTYQSDMAAAGVRGSPPRRCWNAAG